MCASASRVSVTPFPVVNLRKPTFNTFNVKLPNGSYARATYRGTFSDAVYVRVAGRIVSGDLDSVGQGVQTPTGEYAYIYNFLPKGKNAHLVQ